MLQRLIQWLKKFFQRLFSGKQNPVKATEDVHKEAPQPLDDTDLEFLFMELLEGVHQARGQAWAEKWFNNIKDRVSTEDWVNWLQRFGERLLASPTPNTEIASRMVNLGELGVGEIGDVAYDIGMQLLRRAGDEPVWEYDGPDAEIGDSFDAQTDKQQEERESAENFPQGELPTISLEQLLAMLQNDEHLRLQIAHQLGIETDDPEVIIQALINQFNATNHESEEPPN
jgi:hypothetical protein